eukprot:3612653-Rhodomonas_salina.4
MDCRHILVEKHSDAVKILTSINNGEIQFNEAARQHSIDKAGKCGLLGWMTKDQLDPVCACGLCLWLSVSLNIFFSLACLSF